MFPTKALSPLGLLFAITFSRNTVSQVFGDGSNSTSLVIPPPIDLSVACSATFSNPIQCSPLLPMIAWEGYFPSVNDLRVLCNSSCLSSLGNLRNKQEASCASDVLTVAGSMYPATYNVDYFIFTYNYTCRTDRYSLNEGFLYVEAKCCRTTRAWCAPKVDSWGNRTSPLANESCSDCVLGTLQTELNSPFGYSADLATNFTAMTSS